MKRLFVHGLAVLLMLMAGLGSTIYSLSASHALGGETGYSQATDLNGNTKSPHPADPLAEGDCGILICPTVILLADGQTPTPVTFTSVTLFSGADRPYRDWAPPIDPFPPKPAVL